MVAIQKNLDGSYPGLKLKEILKIEPAAKALFNKCVIWGLSNPLEDPEKYFARQIKPAMEKLVGWDAARPELSAPETYEELTRALREAADCWTVFKKLQRHAQGNAARAYAIFKTKFGHAPRFTNTDKRGSLAA